MRKNRKRKTEKIIERIETNLWILGSILEVVRDSCLYNDYTNLEITLKVALRKYYEITEDVSLIS